MLSRKPHAITAGLLESNLKGLFSICSTRYGCAKPRELQTLRFQPGWNDLNQAKLRAEAAGPSPTEESWSLKADCVNTGEGGERGILSPQQSPGACHLAPRMFTAGVFWGVKNTAHSTKLRVTSADSYTPTDSSNKYFQHLIQTWCSQLYRNHKLKEPRSSSGKIENPCFIWWDKVSSPPPRQVSDLHIVFKAFFFKYFLYKRFPPPRTVKIPISSSFLKNWASWQQLTHISMGVIVHMPFFTYL